MRRAGFPLAVVPKTPEPSPAPPTELGLYAETRALARDPDRWRKLHEQSHRRESIVLPIRGRRIFAMKGGGVRQERGGWKYEERL